MAFACDSAVYPFFTRPPAAGHRVHLVSSAAALADVGEGCPVDDASILRYSPYCRSIANTACASEAGVSRQASPLDTQSLTAVARL
jgi:hypothetical protein